MKGLDTNKWEEAGRKLRKKEHIDREQFFETVYKYRLGPYGKQFFAEYLYANQSKLRAGKRR